MPLIHLELPTDAAAVPGEVRALLREADRRIERFQAVGRVPGFVPSDYAGAYRALRGLAAAGLAPGNLFCEWGSGFGVVACLATMLDFDACGIEVEGELVDAARQLAADFGLPVEFVHGSFIPAGARRASDAAPSSSGSPRRRAVRTRSRASPRTTSMSSSPTPGPTRSRRPRPCSSTTPGWGRCW